MGNYLPIETIPHIFDSGTPSKGILKNYRTYFRLSVSSVFKIKYYVAISE